MNGIALPIVLPTRLPLAGKALAAVARIPLDAVADILGAGGLDYAEFDFARIAFLSQDAAGATPVTAAGQTIGRSNVKQKAPHNAQQATGSFRPQYQTGGAKFDGSDDNLLADWLMQAGANCIIGHFEVPAAVAANQTITGQDGTGRLSLYVTPGGVIACRIPDAGTVTVAGDTRGQTVIAAVSVNGASATLFVNGATPVSAAYTTAITANLQPRLGANNASNMAATGFFGGTLRWLAFGKRTISSDEFQRIRSQRLAA